MSVKAHEAYCLDSAQDRLLFYDDFLGDSIRDLWTAAGTGSAAVVDAQDGGVVRLTTGATSGNTEYMHWGDIRSLLVSKKVTMEVRAKLTQTTYVDVWFSLYYDFNNQAFIQHGNNAVGADTWDIRCINGGAATTFDSGILADTDYHIFRIEAFPTDEVHFYIDGVECANSPITTNIPSDAGDYLQPRLYVRTYADAAKSMDIDYVVCRQEI